jgi:hypothetical protein
MKAKWVINDEQQFRDKLFVAWKFLERQWKDGMNNIINILWGHDMHGKKDIKYNKNT